MSFELIMFLVTMYLAWRLFIKPRLVSAPTPTNESAPTKESDMAIREAVQSLRNGLAPVKEQVKTATTDARKTYETTARQARINKLLADPEMLEAALKHSGMVPPPPPAHAVAVPPPPPPVN